jgi:hypothetical protein
VCYRNIIEVIVLIVVLSLCWCYIYGCYVEAVFPGTAFPSESKQATTSEGLHRTQSTISTPQNTDQTTR